MAALGPCSTHGNGSDGLAESVGEPLLSAPFLKNGDIHWLYNSSVLIVASSMGKALAVVLKESSETGNVLNISLKMSEQSTKESCQLSMLASDFASLAAGE